MTSKTAGILVMIGLLITAGGVGGIETSVNDQDMLGAAMISIVGMLIMYAGTLGLRNSHYYD
jgi:hypothetical protein